MPATTKIIGPARGALMTVIDTCELGRPVHVLDRFCEVLHADLAAAVESLFATRTTPGFQLGRIEHSRRVHPHRPLRWFLFDTAAGRLGFSIDRQAALALLARRLGMSNWSQLDQETLQRSETATEQRLAAQVGKRLVQCLSARLLSGLQERAATDTGPAVLDTERHGFGSPTDAQALFLGCDLLDAQGRPMGRLNWVLEDCALDALLRALAPPRRKPAKKPIDPTTLRRQLPMLLDVRLLEKPLSLGDVMALRPGSVLPVDLGLATVRIQDSPVLRASVVEHGGKLCLTSLQEV